MPNFGEEWRRIQDIEDPIRQYLVSYREQDFRERLLVGLKGYLRERRLEQALYTDRVTGAYNDRWVERHIPGIVEQAASKPSKLSLAKIDMGGLGAINNTYGEAAGDEALKTTAAILQYSLRKRSDELARYGTRADEFLICLPDTSEEGAVAYAVRIVSIIREYLAVYDTVPSIGITTYDPLASSAAPTHTDLLKCADDALIDAKKARNGERAIKGAIKPWRSGRISLIPSI